MSSSTITSTCATSARTSFRRIWRTGYNQPTPREPSRRSCAHSREEAMLIVDSQIHLWQNGKMSVQHRQIPTYSADDALAEMASAGVDCAVIHPPSALGEAVNVLAVEAVRQHPDKFCILGHFDLQSPDREKIVARWRERPRRNRRRGLRRSSGHTGARQISQCRGQDVRCSELFESALPDRKSTRLNSSHGYISYAVFCLKKKNNKYC